MLTVTLRVAPNKLRNKKIEGRRFIEALQEQMFRRDWGKCRLLYITVDMQLR